MGKLTDEIITILIFIKIIKLLENNSIVYKHISNKGGYF